MVETLITNSPPILTRLTSPDDIAEIVKKRRKQQNLTQADLAAATGVGVRFIVDLEKGKPTCHLGKTLQVLAILGVRVLGLAGRTINE